MTLLSALAVTLVLFYAWVKNRLAWREVFSLRENLELLRREVVAARKEAILASMAGTARMPLLLPSQNGEEILIWDLFSRRNQGFFVDVGAHDGVALSNTYFLEAVGWSGILVEANPELCSAAARARPFSKAVHAAASATECEVSFTVADNVSALSSLTPDLARIRREGGSTREIMVRAMTLDSLLEDVNEPIDFVSIDVEGGEMDVLRGFDLARFAPQLLVIEDNHDQGELDAYLAPRGYKRFAKIEQNIFFGRS